MNIETNNIIGLKAQIISAQWQSECVALGSNYWSFNIALQGQFKLGFQPVTTTLQNLPKALPWAKINSPFRTKNT